MTGELQRIHDDLKQLEREVRRLRAWQQRITSGGGGRIPIDVIDGDVHAHSRIIDSDGNTLADVGTGDEFYVELAGTEKLRLDGVGLSLKGGLGMKLRLYDVGASQYGFGIQANVMEFIVDAASDDFRWGYGASDALTEVMFLDSGAGQLQIPIVGPGAGILIGDALWYCYAANIMGLGDDDYMLLDELAGDPGDDTCPADHVYFYVKDSGGQPALFYKQPDNTVVGPLGAGGAGADHDHTGPGDGGVLTNDEHDGFSEYVAIATPASPAVNNYRLFGRLSGGNIEIVGKSSQGAECIICTLSNVVHANTLALNWIE